MRFYFAVKHEGVWKTVEALYNEKQWGVELIRVERDVLEAIRNAMAKVLRAEVEEPKEVRNKEGKVVGHSLKLYHPHLKLFLEHTAERVEVKPLEVRLEGRRVVVKAGDVEKDVEFKLLKFGKAEYLIANDVEQTIALYKSLKEVGVPVEITPRGVKVDSEALWALVAIAVKRGVPGELPAVVMPGVELLKIYNVGGVRIYAFRVSEEGLHYYFAVKTGQEWRAAGGKLSDGKADIVGEAAHIVAEAINAIYREMGVERRVEVKLHKDRTPYIRLANVDLELLGLRRRGK